jgi:hypothetical protein
MRNLHRILSGTCEGKRQLENQVMNGKIILKWALKIHGMAMWTE